MNSGAKMVVIALCLAVATVALSGCSATSGSAKVDPRMDNGGDPNVQVCGYCGGSAGDDVVEGVAAPAGDKQVVAIKIVNGEYEPNRITAKAGVPITVEFTPSKPAAGCVAMPTFESLGKKVAAKTDMGSVDLGALEAGAYEFTCGMGTAAGSIVVE